MHMNSLKKKKNLNSNLLIAFEQTNAWIQRLFYVISNTP